MKNLKFGLGFILALSIILAASSLFFRNRQSTDPLDPMDVAAQQSLGDRTKAQEAESISSERGINEQNLDGESSANDEEVAEEPESNLESVFVNLTQEMAKRGYAKGLSDCIESQFRENQGIENPKDLDGMLKICEGQFKIAPQQTQQIREVVVQAIAKAQTKAEEF